MEDPLNLKPAAPVESRKAPVSEDKPKPKKKKIFDDDDDLEGWHL